MLLKVISGTCPICHNEHHVIITECELANIIYYHEHRNSPKITLEKMLHDTPADVRVFINEYHDCNRICGDCQNKLNNTTISGRIRPGNDNILNTILYWYEFDDIEQYDKIVKEVKELMINANTTCVITKENWNKRNKSNLKIINTSTHFVACDLK